jgi:iron complex outermembrane receptor protein
LNLGLNFYSDRFDDYNLDSNFNLDQGNITYGLYINYLYDFYKNLSLESGLRVDLANANNDSSDLSNELFTLPRLNLLYKLNNEISFRIGGGLGYRLPTIFNEESEPIGFDNLSPINYNITKTEKSYGTNFDINYQSNFGTDYLLFSLNQMFFYNQISNPLVLEKTTENFLYTNSINDLISSGFESQLKFTFWYFTWFVGYTYNESAFDNNNKQQLILTPKHSIKGDLLFVLDNKWRIGWDYEYKSSQILSDGSITRDLITTGVIVERTIENFVIFLNAENITDVRQTKYSSLVSKLNNTPQFTDIWAPLDGYFFNFGLKIKL